MQAPLPIMHASTHTQMQLQAHAVSSTLDWVLACIMMHRDSKMIISKTCLDTVSPFVSNAEARSPLHRCLPLHRSISPASN